MKTDPALHILKQIELLKNRGELLQIDDPYPVNPKVRWGHGLQPPHRQLTAILAARHGDYIETTSIISRYVDNFARIPAQAPDAGLAPYWANGWMPSLDGMSLYALTAHHKPCRFVEIGSGNSTKFVAQAIADHGLATKIFSIDPHPRAEIDQLCHRVIRTPLEELPLSFFDMVEAGDIVFVDCSHRALQNSDVVVFFLEVLPALPAGCIVGIHDIFLPGDYPPGWEGRYYSEQYLLATLLLFGADKFRILLPVQYASTVPEVMAPLQDIAKLTELQGRGLGGGIFWMQKL